MTDNIEVYVQNSIRINSPQGLIYIDPFRMQELHNDAAFIFITHDHYDHYSPEDIDKVIGEHTILVIPAKMEKTVRAISGKFDRVITVEPGIRTEAGGLRFETVPAYNIHKPFHPKSSGWVGYIFEVNGEIIYVAGDTDATDEAKNVKCDIALVPIGGTFTMNAGKAAKLVNEIKPKVAIPVHYGEFVGKESDGDDFARSVNREIEVVFKIKF